MFGRECMKSKEKCNVLPWFFTLIKPILVLLILGIVYLFIFQKIGIGIPCVFYELTGYQCPGCGMTHAMSEIWKGNFYGAWEYNALSVTALPIICIYYFYHSVKGEQGRDKEFYVWEYIFLIALFIVVLLYGFFRNKI